MPLKQLGKYPSASGAHSGSATPDQHQIAFSTRANKTTVKRHFKPERPGRNN